MNTEDYLDVFLDESREHLQAVNDNILKLEKQPNDSSLVHEIFRSAHTLKGMAATMGFDDISSLTHKMEDVLDQIRNQELTVTTELIDIIFTAVEYLEDMITEISEGNDGKKDVSDLVHRLEQIGQDKNVNQETKEDNALNTPLEVDEFQNTVILEALEQGFSAYQITVTLKDDCILKGARAYMVFELLENQGEVIQTNPAVEEIEEGNFEQGFSLLFVSRENTTKLQEDILQVSEIHKVTIDHFKDHKTKREPAPNKNAAKESNTASKKPAVSHASKTIRVNQERIDELLNLFEEVVIDRSRLEVISERLKDQELEETIEHMNRATSTMQGLILAMRMVPIEQVFNRFPRMVRGLAKDLHKQINLEIIGAETEIDRTVIDEIGDPLVHLIRNSVDHGIELPSIRRQAGKQEAGNIILRAFHSGNHVFIEIEDDGAGIDRKKVEAKAIEKGLLTKEHAETLTDDEVSSFILSSGFSTADQVSDISGRGVGLDVVKSKIEVLGGKINIASKQGQGSIFTIQLPLTLSIIATLLVKVKQETYAIPLSSIIETTLLNTDQIMPAYAQKVMDFRGQIIPLVSLADVFQVPADDKTEGNSTSVVVVKKGAKLAGLIVDSFIGKKEVVLKSLGNYLQDVFAISGATILGDGQVSLIIDPNALIK
ncbi:chemotaxis protein CheA [Lentibacillus sp. N15]|uniref:chemotaxis protein CheA n=1 Tax=Lentibacillus songyuanensis TaxID=3136161 RepID=UPI0031BA2CE9